MKLTNEIIAFLTNQRNLTALLRGTCGAKGNIKATSLRVKPDMNVAFSWEDETTQLQGWGRVLWPVTQIKAEKPATMSARKMRVAEKLGISYEVYTLPLIGFQVDGEPLLIQWGSFVSDPSLAKRFARYVDKLDVKDLNDFKVLRYNPFRRIIFNVNNQVIRLAKEVKSAAFYTLWDDFKDSQLPVVDLLDAEPTAPAFEYVRGLDGERYLQLASPQQNEEFHQIAGRRFAQLHLVKPDFSQEGKETLQQELLAAAPKILNQIEVHQGVLLPLATRGSVLANVLKKELAQIAAQLKPLEGPLVLSHGDASADQLIVVAENGTHEMYLNDFDRMCLAPAALDLGSYLYVHAHTEVAENAFLRGYREVTGNVPEFASLQMGKLYAALQRLATPLRSAQPDWEKQIIAQINKLNKEYRI
ncbi:aminoglycoside phosphotransferase family protein [Gleimia sp. 6138-11-ORH1]|uniref:aminoglycoside phosphotransferase family protein n=1 Tax=Gleimia sp. 6138-11-ORH1 TaxID=2973937 RepID=UPI002168F3A6|nr:aminoglycoside phosphotransferase family protein [Gleimia sp. 6138-11-ORH1]MCS4484933.1 aminoglycoside phosphotransferase family protein [Gleimia sp. 6138-11-ORH1]